MNIAQEIIELLEVKSSFYNRPDFITTDPISIPHSFTRKEDIEIAAFLTATISWGQRTTIINNAGRLMQMMDDAPFEFVMNAGMAELENVSGFQHRTFNGVDVLYFIHSLRNLYAYHGGLEGAFNAPGDVKDRIISFRKKFLELPGPERTRKHVADPSSGASAKRINMFLRWMVRKDSRGVDFGIWGSVSPSQLYCPLDVHSGNVARKLGLLKRKQNDWNAVEELTESLRQLDARDPVRFDFALFGLGVFEKF